MYAPKDNPLNGVKVEMPNRCAGREHWIGLMLFGWCSQCRRSIGYVREDAKVFSRLEQLQKAGL